MNCVICETQYPWHEPSVLGMCDACYVAWLQDEKPPISHAINLNNDGSLEFLGGEDPLSLPLRNTRQMRFSHVWPVNPVKRIAFRILRGLFGERGRVSEWTRSWRGPWRAVICRTGETFESRRRIECIDWERQRWLAPIAKL